MVSKESPKLQERVRFLLPLLTKAYLSFLHQWHLLSYHNVW